jgi:small subunit ribosomal protein S1
MADESMNSLEDLLDQHDYDMPKPGDIRIGVVVANTPQGLIVDLGLKRDGIVPQSDIAKLEPEEREALKVNDEVPVYIVQTEDPEALVVSIHLARLSRDWIEAEALLASGEIFEGEVIGYNKGGVIVPYGRIRGFVPISHLSDVTPGMGERRRQQRLARLRGEMIGVKIIEVDRQRHRLVMSQREAQKEWEEKKRGELMETLKPGDVRTGRISGMRDFGAFVDLGGADGLVHISELSWHRVDHPREVVKLGDEVEVQVLGVDQETGRISLSRKKLLPNPWDTVSERYVQNELVEGKITRILDYGAFAEIEPGVEGLLHVSQLSRNPVEDPRAVVAEGEVHLLRVVSIDQKRQRIGLSLKAVTPTEQIEWMAQKELAEALRQEEEDAATAAREARRAEKARVAEAEREAAALTTADVVEATGGESEAAAAEPEAAAAGAGEAESATSVEAEAETVVTEPPAAEMAGVEDEVEAAVKEPGVEMVESGEVADLEDLAVEEPVAEMVEASEVTDLEELTVEETDVEVIEASEVIDVAELPAEIEAAVEEATGANLEDETTAMAEAIEAATVEGVDLAAEAEAIGEMDVQEDEALADNGEVPDELDDMAGEPADEMEPEMAGDENEDEAARAA